jgi:hypothetical protein
MVLRLRIEGEEEDFKRRGKINECSAIKGI